MTPEYWLATAGGLLIGLASLLLLLLNGRIAGISGITWAAVTYSKPIAWRWLFLAGLLGGGVLAHGVAGVPLPHPSRLGTPMAILGGLVVGIGIRLGNGCTSGHGVCGMGLLSPRSISATLTFMGAGIVTVYTVRHVLGLGL